MSKITISAAKGTVSIGSINTGDRSTTTTIQNIKNNTNHTMDISKLKETITSLGTEHNAQEKDIQSLLSTIESIANDPERKTSNTKIDGWLKTIQENYEWAYPVLKDFFVAISG